MCPLTLRCRILHLSGLVENAELFYICMLTIDVFYTCQRICILLISIPFSFRGVTGRSTVGNSCFWVVVFNLYFPSFFTYFGPLSVRKYKPKTTTTTKKNTGAKKFLLNTQSCHMHRDCGVFSELDTLSTGFNALQFGYQTKAQNTLNNVTLRRS